MNSQKTPSNPQKQKFIDKARELGCDEDEAAFEAKLKRIAGAKPTKKGRKKVKSQHARTAEKQRGKRQRQGEAS